MQVHQEQARFDFSAAPDLMSSSGSQLGTASTSLPSSSAAPHSLLLPAPPSNLHFFTSDEILANNLDHQIVGGSLLGLAPHDQFQPVQFEQLDQQQLHVQQQYQQPTHSTAAAVAAALLAANCYDGVPNRIGAENLPVKLEIDGFDEGFYNVNTRPSPFSTSVQSTAPLFCQPLSISTSSNLIDPISPTLGSTNCKDDKNWQRCELCLEGIRDPFMLSVGTQNYHGHCLRCSNCALGLEEMPTCYVKHDQLYCKSCYAQKHLTKCAHCERLIQATDWVRRAGTLVFHLACFSCQHCKRQLSTGEQFSLQENQLLCKQHYLELVQGEDTQTKTKTKRVRTTFAEEQLSILQAHFQCDCNPDGSDLERIAAQTGLSKRVTQVWFQNSRARQKKHQGHKKPHGPNSVHESSVSGRSSRATSQSNLSPAPKSPGEHHWPLPE